jgi:predicted aspartyl protease
VKTLSTIVVLAALTCAASAQTCTLKEYASLDMSVQPNGTIGVPVTIGGAQRTMLVDLSEHPSGITPSLAKQLNLQVATFGNGRFVEAFGRFSLATVTVPEIKIGSALEKDVQVLLLPDPPSLPEDVGGFIGTSLLDQFDLEFDFQNRKLNLFSQDHCPGGAVVYWADSAAQIPFTEDEFGTIEADMQLDGKTVKVNLFTLATGNTMPLDAAARLFGLSPDSPDMKVVTASLNGSPGVYRYPFRSLSAGGLSIANPDIVIMGPTKILITSRRMSPSYLAELMTSPHIRFTKIGAPGGDVKVGLAELKKFHFFVAFKENLIYLTAADAHK